MKRPVATFVYAAIFGALASLTISLNLMLFIVVTTMTVIVPLWMRSAIALSGALCGFGATWLVLIGTSYTRCVTMGANCVGSEGLVPFLVVAGAVLAVGLAIGVVGWTKARNSNLFVDGLLSADSDQIGES